MITRRTFVCSTSAILAVATVPGARAQPALPLVTVYKEATCGCCGKWVRHMRDNDFRVEAFDVSDVALLRRKHGVPDQLSSCHTAIVDGYVIEGHVPAADVKRLLREKIRAKGLAVPGMVDGSPGMEQRTPKPYATLVFDERGSKVFERH